MLDLITKTIYRHQLETNYLIKVQHNSIENLWLLFSIYKQFIISTYIYTFYIYSMKKLSCNNGMFYSTTEQYWTSHYQNKYVRGIKFVISCQATLQWLATLKYLVINKYKLQDTMNSNNTCIDYWKTSMVLRLHFLVKYENAQPLSTNTTDVGQQVSNRLNRVNLFLQKFRLQVVTEIGIIVDGTNLMQRQQALKHTQSGGWIYESSH